MAINTITDQKRVEANRKKMLAISPAPSSMSEKMAKSTNPLLTLNKKQKLYKNISANYGYNSPVKSPIPTIPKKIPAKIARFRVKYY